ncbi:type I restriction endonuclease subunit R, partial [Helicobacter pylori]
EANRLDITPPPKMIKVIKTIKNIDRLKKFKNAS